MTSIRLFIHILVLLKTKSTKKLNSAVTFPYLQIIAPDFFRPSLIEKYDVFMTFIDFRERKIL